MSQGNLKRSLIREAVLFAGLLIFGFVVVPILIYWIGPQILGDFGGVGYADFFNSISTRILSGDAAAWFFVLSPYLAIQTLRLAWFGWRSL